MINVHNLNKVFTSQVKSGNFYKDLFDRQYKKSVAIDNISFEIGRGELVGFIGPNGAGKTTTMKMLSGILFPTSGKIEVLGYNPFEKKHAFLKQIAFIMGQKNQLLWDLAALDAFRLNQKIYEISDHEYKKNLNELVDLLEAQEFITRPVKTLSLGQRMRCELIAALLHRPKILFLDEPTIGLDIFAQTTIRSFIKTYQEQTKATIMLTSHYMQDVERLAQRILVIDHGKIIFDDKLDKLILKYSNKKHITLTLKDQLHDFSVLPKDIKYTYTHPELTISVPKEGFQKILQQLLDTIEFSDLTVEDETIEDMVKKIFD